MENYAILRLIFVFFEYHFSQKNKFMETASFFNIIRLLTILTYKTESNMC